MTLPEAPAQTPPVAPPETNPARLAAASNSSSESSDTASSYCAAVSGTRCGGSNLISGVFFANHRRAGRGAKQ